jgi:hypothetical protein
MLKALRKLVYFQNPSALQWVFYFSVFAILHIPAITHTEGVNAYVLYAQSLLNGTIELRADNFDYMDMIVFNGKHYLPYPPFPALLLLPFVAIFGTHINAVLIAFICSCLNLFLLNKIFDKISVTDLAKPLLLTAFFFGTGYWYVLVTSHHVYQFAHIIATSLLLLLINEILHKKRWWLVAIFIGCSFLTRQFTIFYIVFIIAAMYKDYMADKKLLLKNFFWFGSVLSLFAGIYLLYNYRRFGNALDAGYTYINYIGVLKARVDADGVFSSKYFLFNFYSVFIKGFNIFFTGPGEMNIKDVDLWGTSLLVASPFVVASIKAKWNKQLLAGAWGTVILILTGILFYHNNGYNQVNCMRFTLDLMPILFVLIALGIKQLPLWLLKLMVFYAVFLNITAFIIHYLYQ